MDNNSFIFDLLRNKWLISLSHVQEFETIANRFLLGQNSGDILSRETFLAQFQAQASGGSASYGRTEENKIIGYMKMVGPLATYGGWWSYGADDYLDALRYMNENDKFSAIVLDVDGPGGAVPAINAFKEFALEKKKPIVVLCNDLCSLHYWMSCLIADHIMAKGNISPRIGSIGATCILVDSREAMKKDGYSVMIINAPGSDLKNKALSDFYEGKDEDFKKRIQDELAPIQQIFVADVKAAMPGIGDDDRIFQADTFSADEALKLGMIHSIGNEKQAFQMAEALAELSE